MEKECIICGKSMGALSSKVKISDGYVCIDCWKAAGLGTTINDMATANSKTSENIKAMINENERNKKLIENFKPTKEIGNYIRFDDVTKTFVIGPKNKGSLYKYENIVDYELLEDGETITKGGLGRAMVGGALFGGVGAVVGGVTGHRKTKDICNSMKIKITLKDSIRPVEYINLISSSTKKNGIVYKTCYNIAQEIISCFKIICDEKQRRQIENQPTSSADEIMKFKNLLDAGVITQEEYEAKKKQLLGL